MKCPLLNAQKSKKLHYNFIYYVRSKLLAIQLVVSVNTLLLLVVCHKVFSNTVSGETFEGESLAMHAGSLHLGLATYMPFTILS